MSTADCISKSKVLSTREAANVIARVHESLSNTEQYEFIHSYIAHGGVLEPLYMAVGEDSVKQSKHYILQKILHM